MWAYQFLIETNISTGISCEFHASYDLLFALSKQKRENEEKKLYFHWYWNLCHKQTIVIGRCFFSLLKSFLPISYVSHKERTSLINVPSHSNVNHCITSIVCKLFMIIISMINLLVRRIKYSIHTCKKFTII